MKWNDTLSIDYSKEKMGPPSYLLIAEMYVSSEQ